MNLSDTVNKLGHYAKKAAKAIIKPVNTFLAVSTISAIMSVGELQAQNNIEADTLWGQAVFQVINEENTNFISGVALSLHPDNMNMVIPDTTYLLLTDNNGSAVGNFPVYIDSTVGIEELISNKPQILPSFGSELNAFFPKIERGIIELYDLSGKLVRKEEFNDDHKYLALNDLSAGMYIYNIRTENGRALSGKFMNQNVPLRGPSSKPSIKAPKVNTKSSLEEVATYWAKWEKEGYYTDSTLIELLEGNNGFINFYITPLPGIPQNQDLIGIAKDGNNNYAPLAGVTARLFNQTTSTLIEVVTDVDGRYEFPDVPSGSIVSIDIGGLDGKYSFNNIGNYLAATLD